jgi:hypothetical protein
LTPPATFPISLTYRYMAELMVEHTWGIVSLCNFSSALILSSIDVKWSRGLALVLLGAWYGVIGILSFLSVPWSLAPGLMLAFTMLCYLLLWKN